MSYQPPPNYNQYIPYNSQRQQQYQQQAQSYDYPVQQQSYPQQYPTNEFLPGGLPPIDAPYPAQYSHNLPLAPPQPGYPVPYDPYQQQYRAEYVLPQGSSRLDHQYGQFAPAAVTSLPSPQPPQQASLYHASPSLGSRYSAQASASPLPSVTSRLPDYPSPLPNHIDLCEVQSQAQSHPPSTPLAFLPPPDSTSTPAAPSSTGALKIRLKLPASNPPVVAEMSRPTRSSPSVKIEQDYTPFPERPRRSNQAVRPPRYADGADDDEEEDEDNYQDSEPEVISVPTTSRSGRVRKPVERFAGGAPNGNTHDENGDEDALGEDDFEDSMHTTLTSAPNAKSTRSKLQALVRGRNKESSQAEWEAHAGRRRSSGRLAFPPQPVDTHDYNGVPDSQEEPIERSGRSTRAAKRAKSRHSSADAESFAPSNSASVTEDEEPPSEDLPDDDYDDEDEDDDFDNGPRRGPSRSRSSRRPARRAAPAPRRSTRNSARARDSEEDYGPKKRTLRERAKVDYALPPLDISAELQSAVETISGPGRKGGLASGTSKRLGAGAWKSAPWTSRLNQVTMANNRDGDSSESDLDLLPPIRGGAGAAGLGAGTGGGQATYGSGGGAMKTDVQNFGRVNPKSNMADADPLGVDVNVTFDNVGGLDGHINQLKEMVALPLLYPEVFQQFGITPPRGVLFHGPPGTGKTLLARALAASCSNGNTKIAFFMRKGADVLSKWVGEAERQLRMLFEEARAAQPSIIFFDEIDGLAPVRSSKQDQIHASLVSTLLALMDGMDGRGQVIVIGATNRPDAVDPALRRPGRFDREFYFPLPNKEARKKIISINTRKWTPQLSDQILDQLAGLTKGYGGADLRALCTEAALNAVQRRYPQIYSSEDRLLLDPSSITVGAKDFMMSVKKIVPSSARSSSSAALQLPVHLVSILQSPLERLKVAVDKILPRNKAKSALEEAQYEDEVEDDLEKHAMIHSLDKMRTYRPRILLQGPAGMGQGYLGPAILHHLEGFHVQSLDLGNLLGDSTRTSEAAIVQLFVEAKRHQPSVLFIPSLLPWSLALTETARTTFRALLDSVPSSDPVLLLAILDGPVSDLPKDVRRWFGIGKEGRVELGIPSADERTAYFASLVKTYSKPPTSFPDALPRRKRVLEILPLAPPLPPRPLTQAEIERDLDEDDKARHMMLLSFSPLWPDVEKKYGRSAIAAKTGAQNLYQEWMEAIDVAKEAATSFTAAVNDGASNDIAVVPNGNDLVNGDGQPIVPAPPVPAILSTDPTPLAVSTSTSSLPSGFPPVQHDLTNLFDADSPIAPPVVLPEIVIQEVIPTVSGAAPGIPSEPKWKPHDIDLSRIGQRVLRYKYFAPQDFIDDILKIVENAKNFNDPSILLKTEELLAQIKAHVDAFDPQWLPRFDRYRKRMLERKAEAVKRREEAEAAKKEADQNAPATVAEAAAGAAASEVVGDVTNGLKRGREDEGADGERDGKRARDETMELDASDNHLAAPGDSLVNGTPDPSQLSLAGTEASFVTTDTTIPSVPPPRRPSPPPPVYPPFICPEGDIAKLGAELRVMTGDLNVDQLEQLRAGLYDLIWRSRSEWDRREVLAKAVQKLREFVGEVRELEDE